MRHGSISLSCLLVASTACGDGSVTDVDAGAADTGSMDTPPMDTGPDGRELLEPADFAFLGSYSVNNLNGLVFGTGLALRYVDGQLRFLAFAYDRSSPVVVLDEFALPDGSDGSATAGEGPEITALTRQWNDIWTPYASPNAGGGDHYGVWWEEDEARLWTTRAVDYPDGMQMDDTRAITVRSLNDDGTVSDLRGEYGIEGIGQRAIYGGVQPIPAWFRTATGIPNRYVVGFGGYSSRMAQGLTPSMGLMVVAIPDVADLSTDPMGVTIPATAVNILADHRSGATAASDWYDMVTPPARPPFDRGARSANVINYFDGGDDRPNGTTGEAPAGPPLPAAQWLSPAPDGRGRMVWNDTFNATANWIEGERRYGLVTVLNGSGGKAWYCNSMLCRERAEAEIQIFDPNDLARVHRGELEPWNVQPVSMRPITMDGGASPRGNVVGAAYDARTRIFWVWWTGIDGAYASRLLAYRVEA